MLSIPFTPNDAAARKGLFRCGLFEALEALEPDRVPLWGAMGPQQMVEHLAWTFGISTGQVGVECRVPEERRRLARPFITDDSRNLRNFPNPALAAGLPPLRCPDLPSAILLLRAEVDRFLRQLQEDPGALRTHPVLGPVDSEDWACLHFKHCHHHLAQFALVAEG